MYKAYSNRLPVVLSNNIAKKYEFLNYLAYCFSAKTQWILNTIKNVKSLEKHVGKEVARFMKENVSIVPHSPSVQSLKSENVIKSQSLPSRTRKVL